MSATAHREIAVPPIETPPEPPAVQRRFWDTPVAWWAAIGGLLLAGEAYIFIRWFLSSDLRDVPAGPTPVPSWRRSPSFSPVSGSSADSSS